jgi:hypothetical protein
LMPLPKPSCAAWPASTLQHPDTRTQLLKLRAAVREQINKREDWNAERWIAHMELARDKSLGLLHRRAHFRHQPRRLEARADAGAQRHAQECGQGLHPFLR